MRHYKKGQTVKRDGRPSLYTPARLVALFRAIAEGMPRDEAARHAGISKRTLQRWLKAGRMGDPRYAELAEAITTAERLAGWGNGAGKAVLELCRRRVF